METEELLSNFETYSKFFKKYFPEEGASQFLEDFGVRLTTCPRGLTSKEGGKPGALIEYLMRVTLVAKQHADVISNQDKETLDIKSLVRASLVHEIGKVGSLSEDLYIRQESQWHRDKLGQNFKYNEECSKMSVSHRTLFLLQKYEISLGQEEWLSILTSQGMHYPENAFYGNSLPIVARVLHFAKTVVDSENT